MCLVIQFEIKYEQTAPPAGESEELLPPDSVTGASAVKHMNTVSATRDQRLTADLHTWNELNTGSRVSVSESDSWAKI